ncbi:MAG: Rieske 2Fe-2S domain-containing protein [Cyclobacteriaceae bacterium]|nr:Rieske 2Fe-2S domain-containing protein [Cyclobacteriaceae bacterium HetDA_MAG_MS6]
MIKVKLFNSISEGRNLIAKGEIKQVVAEGKSLCVANYEGQFYAFASLCPHMGQRLHQGHLNTFGEVICPLHTYRFHLKTGVEAERRCGEMKVYEIIEDPDGLHLII